MKKKVIAITATLIAILALLVAGCSGGVSEADYNRVVSERDQALAQVTDLQNELTAAEEEVASLEEQIAGLQEELDVAKEQKAALEEQVATLEAQIAAANQRIAEDFVKNSPTFIFDGIEESLELVNTAVVDENKGWEFTFKFESAHAGYGDRIGQMLAEVITLHEAVITVENCEVTSAVLDGKWDMINQEMLAAVITEEEARQTAEDFVRNSPTFVFDGIEDTLELVETLYPDTENAWQFVYEFDSRHAGYGDREGQILAQVITPHQAIITVEDSQVVSAIMDEQWNMLTQRMISDLEDATWILTSYTGEMGTRQALEDIEVTLIFDSEENRLGGSAGCNDYGAPYEIDGSNLTLTDNITQTLILCSEEIMEQENNFLEALKVAENYEVDGDNLTITGGGWTLEFKKQ